MRSGMIHTLFWDFSLKTKRPLRTLLLVDVIVICIIYSCIKTYIFTQLPNILILLIQVVQLRSTHRCDRLDLTHAVILILFQGEVVN